MGTGHVMRCLALAQAWQTAGGRAVLLGHLESDALRAHVSSAGVDVLLLQGQHPDPADLQQTLDSLAKLGATWLAVDGYHFDAGYNRAVKAEGYKVLVIDDRAHLPEYCADIILNQNAGADMLSYQTAAGTRLLLGPSYVLLREEFLPYIGWHREHVTSARRVLVTLGGADPENVTQTVIEALLQTGVDDLEARVVVGPANPHASTLQKGMASQKGEIELLADPPDMPALMAWADVAVAAAGSTCWELAFMGLPSILLVLAKNQAANAERLGEDGIAVNLGWYHTKTPGGIAQALTHLLSSAEQLAELSSRGQSLVDGQGGRRVVEHLLGTLTLRRAREEDVRLVWEWANDPEVRAVSLSSEPIPWESHLKWYAALLADPNRVLFVAVEHEGRLVGQVRFDLAGDEATISVSLAPSARGKGYGTEAIALGSQEILRSKAKMVHAYIKPGNESSVKAFVKAGFQMAGEAVVRGQQVLRLTLRAAG